MLIACAQGYKKIYILEDHVQAGGFGSAVTEFFAQRNVSPDLHIFAWPDCFIPHASSNGDLEKMFHFTPDAIAMKIADDFKEGK
jgi:deoxyxylulose-5-phosphate synthase